jgi:ubiquinone/menaquinone biosynthesis C-methylase UbiE
MKKKEAFDRKDHWEHIYQTREQRDLSWYEPSPENSLNFFRQLQIPPDARIIDIGAGDSLLVDHLLKLGYPDITVLDISKTAIDRAQKRLGTAAQKVTWIVGDATSFQPGVIYDVWHDRAMFHFLTEENEISTYLGTVYQSLAPGGFFLISTFSKKGPAKCSGMVIKQYSDRSITQLLKKWFEKINCIPVSHHTPFKTIQDFIYCSFRKKNRALSKG